MFQVTLFLSFYRQSTVPTKMTGESVYNWLLVPKMVTTKGGSENEIFIDHFLFQLE